MHGLHVPAPPAPRRAPPRAPPVARPVDPAASGPGPGGAWGRGWKAARQDPGRRWNLGLPARAFSCVPCYLQGQEQVGGFSEAQENMGKAGKQLGPWGHYLGAPRPPSNPGRSLAGRRAPSPSSCL